MRHVTVRLLHLALAAVLLLPPPPVTAASQPRPHSVPPTPEQTFPSSEPLALQAAHSSIYLPVATIVTSYRQTPSSPASASNPPSNLEQTEVYTYFLSYDVGSITIYNPGRMHLNDAFSALSGPLQAKAYLVLLV